MRLNENIEIHNTLNPKIWNGFELKPDVQDKLMEIVEYFKECCNIPLEIADIHLVGSNASYNYTQYSDIDLHIVVNFDLIDIPDDVLELAYNTEKASFNSTYDITIKGINTEIYVENIKSGTMSNGIYSVMYSKWIKKPLKLDDIPKIEFGDELDKWKSYIDKALKSNDIDKVKQTINALYMIRKNSIAIDGEYGKGNQIFKEMRNLGLLDDLKDKVNELMSSQLSLENFGTKWDWCNSIVD